MKYKTVLVAHNDKLKMSKYKAKCIPEAIECGGMNIGDTIIIAVDRNPKNAELLDGSPLTRKYINYDDEVIELEFIVTDKRHIVENFGDEATNGSIVGGFIYLQPKTQFVVKIMSVS